MSLIKVLTFAKDVVVVGAKGFWNTPVDTSNFTPLGDRNQGDAKPACEEGGQIGRALIGDPSVVCDRPDIWAAYQPSDT